MLLRPLLALWLIWPWLIRLGGPGLVLIGLADNSVVPLTGSMDVLTLWLAAGHRNLWPYYAVMATIGAVIGGYLTYALGRKGGKEAIQRKLRKDKAEKLFRRFQRWGFGTIVVASLLPPPFPLVPVLLAAGALQYSRKKFVGALTLGRIIRYSLVAGLGSLYAQSIMAFFNRYHQAAVLTLVALAAIGGALTLREYLRARRGGKPESSRQPARQAA
jgi:membrane protein YqaA with SNARE-associated domain